MLPSQLMPTYSQSAPKHRDSILADELGTYGKGAFYAKMESRCFGMDSEYVGIDWDGNKV